MSNEREIDNAPDDAPRQASIALDRADPLLSIAYSLLSISASLKKIAGK
jgi:hypothetical protein